MAFTNEVLPPLYPPSLSRSSLRNASEWRSRLCGLRKEERGKIGRRSSIAANSPFVNSPSSAIQSRGIFHHLIERATAKMKFSLYEFVSLFFVAPKGYEHLHFRPSTTSASARGPRPSRRPPWGCPPSHRPPKSSSRSTPLRSS